MPEPAERGWYGAPRVDPGFLVEAELELIPSTKKPRREPLADLWSTQDLRLGPVLGRAGGQGAVYQLVEFPDFVYKRYHRSMRGAAQSFDELIVAGQALAPFLEHAGVTAVWPVLACGVGSQVDGYVMQRIPDRFSIEMNTPYGSRIEDATLDHALAIDPTKKFRSNREVSPEERLEIVRLVGVFLDTLHRNDLVYGDLSLKNLRYSLDPVRLLVMDLDAVHRISTPLIDRKDLVHTPDWGDPLAPGQVPLGFDLDRYRFSLLVYRLVVANSVSQGFPDDPGEIRVEPGKGLDSGQRSRLELLLRRAAEGGHGSRPPISEWLEALDSVGELSDPA